MSRVVSSRPSSVSKASSVGKNGKFVTKWKFRNGNKSVLDTPNDVSGS